MDFGDALKELKKGKFIKREEWGNNVLYLSEIEQTRKELRSAEKEEKKTFISVQNMNTISNDSTAHSFSSKDVLAEDWIVFEDEVEKQTEKVKTARKKK